MKKLRFPALVKLLAILAIFGLKNTYAYDMNYDSADGSNVPYTFGWGSVQQNPINPPANPLTIELEGKTYEIQRLLPRQEPVKTNDFRIPLVNDAIDGLFGIKHKSAPTSRIGPSTVGLIYADPANKTLSGYSAIRINDTIYELNKLSGNQAVYNQRSYQDVVNDYQTQLIEVRPKFLTNEQIVGLQRNLKQGTGKTFSYDFSRDNFTKITEGEFNRIGVNFSDFAESSMRINPYIPKGAYGPGGFYGANEYNIFHNTIGPFEPVVPDQLKGQDGYLRKLEISNMFDTHGIMTKATPNPYSTNPTADLIDATTGLTKDISELAKGTKPQIMQLEEQMQTIRYERSNIYNILKSHNVNAMSPLIPYKLPDSQPPMNTSEEFNKRSLIDGLYNIPTIKNYLDTTGRQISSISNFNNFIQPSFFSNDNYQIPNNSMNFNQASLDSYMKNFANPMYISPSLDMHHFSTPISTMPKNESTMPLFYNPPTYNFNPIK